MQDELHKILYGEIYDASPGSDRHREQCRRIQEAIALINSMENEMAKKKKPPERPEKEEKPSSFRDRMVKKLHDDPAGDPAEGVGKDGV